MKNKGLKNRFNPEEVKSAWCFWYKCLWCGMSGADSLHHIKSPSSQDYVEGDFNSSVLNSFPIHNEKCHLYNPKLHKLENERKMILKVLKILLRNDYSLKEKDIIFIKKYFKE